MQLRTHNCKKCFFVLALWNNKFFITAEIPEILALLQYTMNIAYIIHNI